MIYDTATDIDTRNGAISKTTQKRITVHSMFYNDVRYDWAIAMEGTGMLVIRGNIRQVGSTVSSCPYHPSSLPSIPPRCTWNWNFVVDAGRDDEEWFERDTPAPVWAVALERHHYDETELYSDFLTKSVETHEFSVVFPTDSNLDNVLFEPDAAKYFSAVSKSRIEYGITSFSFSMHCLTSSPDGNGEIITANTKVERDQYGYFDIFADCYYGDEIHFRYTIPNTNKAMNDLGLSGWYLYTVFPTYW